MHYDPLFYALMLVYVLIGVAWGLWRGLMKSRIRLGTLVLSFVGALLATFTLKRNLADLNVMELLHELEKSLSMDMTQVYELLEISPSLGKVVLASAGSVLAPLVFLVFFILLSVVTGIAYFIVAMVLRKTFKAIDEKSRLRKTRAAVLAVVQCLIVVVVLMVPIASYVELAQPVIEELVEADVFDKETEQVVVDFNKNNIIPLNNSSSVKIFRAMGGRALCHSLTEFKIDETKVSLEKEIGSIASFASKVVSLGSTKIEDYGPAQADLIDALADSFEGSVLLPTIGGEIIHSATDAWLKGETFFGAPCPDMEDAIEPIFLRLLRIVHADSLTVAYLQEDIHTVADFIGVLAVHDIFASLSDTDNLMVVLGSEGVVKDLIAHLGANPRMKVLIPEITNMGMRAIATTLGIPEDVEGVYNNFLNDVATIMNDTKDLPMAERIETISNQLDTSFEEAGVAIDDEIIDGYTNALIADLGNEEVTPEYVADFFTMYAIATAEGGADKSDETLACTVLLTDAEAYNFTCPAYVGKSMEQLLRSTGASTLASVCQQLLEIVEEDPETFATIANAVFENEFTNLLAEHPEAEAMMASIMNITVTAPISAAVVENTAGLQSATEMKTTVITLGDLLIDPDAAAENINADTLEGEAQTIDAIFSSAISLMDTFSKEDAEVELTSIAGSIGGIMDSLSNAQSFGAEKTASLFTAVMQSETVRETANLSIAEATALAGKATEGTPDYTKTMTAVATGVNIANSMNSDEMASEEEILELLNNMTPQTAGMLQTYVTPDRLAGYGVPAENTDISAQLLGNMFEYMSHDLPDYEAEARAISHMLNIATAARDSEEADLFGGKLPEAYELIEIIMASDAVCNALTSTLSDGTVVTVMDPFGVAAQIPDDSSEEQELLDAVYAYRDSQPQSATLDLRLQALAALFGESLEF